MTLLANCAYCYEVKTTEGWHDCRKSLEAKASIQSNVDKMISQYRPTKQREYTHSNKIEHIDNLMSQLRFILSQLTTEQSMSIGLLVDRIIEVNAENPRKGKI